jgi:nicotinamidase/pyrazinamidase
MQEISMKALASDPKAALLVVDLQKDFLPGGALAVSGGDEIVEPIQKWMDAFQNVFLTQDSHPTRHISFASSYPGKKPFEVLTYKDISEGFSSSPFFEREEILKYLSRTSGNLQVLWPDHCVEGSSGWQLHESLRLRADHLVIKKGMRREADSYSAFFENDGERTGLTSRLQERGIVRLVVVGLAEDYCVGWSAEDAVREGLQVFVCPTLTRAVNFPAGSCDAMRHRLRNRGIVSLSTGE